MSGIMVAMAGNSYGKAEVIFDSYGLTELLPTSLTYIAHRTKTSGVHSERTHSHNSRMLASHTSTSGLDSILVTGRLSISGTDGSTQVATFQPSSGSTWQTVSSVSHVTETYHSEEDDDRSATTAESRQHYIASSRFVDSTSHKVLGRNVYWNGVNTSGLDHGYRQITHGSGGFAHSEFKFGWSGQRYNNVIDSTDAYIAVASKDQSGSNSGFSGQPNAISIKKTGVTGAQYYVTKSEDINSHPTLGRGVFLNARHNSSGNPEMFYLMFNGDHHSSNDTTSDGIYVVRFTEGVGIIKSTLHDIFIGAYTTFNDNWINTCSSFYPHGMITRWDSEAGSAAIATKQNWYVNTSTLTSDGATCTPVLVPSFTNFGSQINEYPTQIGLNGNNPVYAVYHSGNTTIRIRTYYPATNTWDSSDMATLYNTDFEGITGLWPIPNTNRILASKMSGWVLIEMG
tara:strand:+ start:397 stop:1761 length:1365 start_codon:yes stop_codon:yes gene_type:complete